MLIGLCGLPQVGKSEVRKILVEEHGFYLLDTKQVLREMAAILTGLKPSDFESQADKQAFFDGVPRRTIMGMLGNVAEELWDDGYMLRRALELAPKGRVVVDALRKDQPKFFPSNGVICQVIGNRAIDTGNDFDKFYQGNTDKIIINDGSLDELRASVKRVFEL
jgi:hypothetical protein